MKSDQAQAKKHIDVDDDDGPRKQDTVQQDEEDKHTSQVEREEWHQQADKEGAVLEEQTNSHDPNNQPYATATTAPVRMMSQMAKDPLGVGIPLPVLVPVPQAAAGAEAGADAFSPTSTPLQGAKTDPTPVTSLAAAAADTTNTTATTRTTSLPAGAYSIQPSRICARRTAQFPSADAPADTRSIQGEDIISIGDESSNVRPVRRPDAATDECTNETNNNDRRTPSHADFEDTAACMNTIALGRTATFPLSSESSSSLGAAPSTAAAEREYMVEARLVEDADPETMGSSLDQDIEQTQQQGPPEQVIQAKPLSRWSQRMSPRRVILGLCIVAIVVVALVAGLVVMVQRSDNKDDGFQPAEQTEMTNDVDDTPPPLLKPGLERVKEAGILRCGTTGEVAKLAEVIPILQQIGSNGVEELKDTLRRATQFDLNLCNAIAAAILGDVNPKIELVNTFQNTKYRNLTDGQVDVLISRDPFNMQQDVYEETARDGLAYSIPYFFSEVGFSGHPDYVACADNNLKTIDECTGLKICITKGWSFTNELSLKVPKRQILVVNTTDDVFMEFLAGNCNVMATTTPEVPALLVLAMGYEGEVAIGTKHFTSELWSLVSLDRDPEFANVLNAVLMALLWAEAHNITRETADQMSQTNMFSEEHKDIFRNAVKAGGNFGEIYTFPANRGGRNHINDGTTGMLESSDLGHSERPGNAGLRKSGTIEHIRDRGMMNCGIRGNRPGFASFNTEQGQWEGIDVDFCLALASSLFDGDMTNVNFRALEDTNRTGYELLHSGEVDVLAGATWTLEMVVREPTTDIGYSFSQPYFYGPVNDTRFDENLCLATRQDDAQWSSFVFWTVESTLYAEEQNIRQLTSSEMPLIHIYGTELQRIFRDSVYAVGNYGEIYERNLPSILPRGGRNMLYSTEEHGPLRYIPPGFGH